MLVMIKVRNAFSGQNEGGEGIVGQGIVDLRTPEVAIQTLTLLKTARPVDTPVPADVTAKNPSLYEVLPVAVRAALNKAQATLQFEKAKTRKITTRTVACKRFWHAASKTHNSVEVEVALVSVPTLK